MSGAFDRALVRDVHDCGNNCRKEIASVGERRALGEVPFHARASLVEKKGSRRRFSEISDLPLSYEIPHGETPFAFVRVLDGLDSCSGTGVKNADITDFLERATAIEQQINDIKSGKISLEQRAAGRDSNPRG